MSDLKSNTKREDKKVRGRGKIRDVLPDGSKPDIGFNKSLDSLLTVQKAPVFSKHKSYDGSNTSRPDLFSDKANELLGKETDYQDSLDVKGEHEQFPKDVAPSNYMPFTETQAVEPGLNEPSIPANNDCDIAHHKNDTVYGEATNKFIAVNEEEMTGLISSTIQSEAYEDVLLEDNDGHIQSILQLQFVEADIGALPSPMIEGLVAETDRSEFICDDLGNIYKETYAELSLEHEQEMDILQLEKSGLEDQIKELTVNLLVAESSLAAKDEEIHSLHERNEFLENLLRQKEEKCQEELRDVLARQIKSDVVLKAKEEVEDEVAGREKGGEMRDTEAYIEKMSDFLVNSMLYSLGSVRSPNGGAEHSLDGKKWENKTDLTNDTVEILKSQLRESISEGNTLRAEVKLWKNANEDLEKKASDYHQQLFEMMSQRDALLVERNNLVEEKKVHASPGKEINGNMAQKCSSIPNSGIEKKILKNMREVAIQTEVQEIAMCDWSRATEATQYIDCILGHDLNLIDASCQVTQNYSDADCQVSALNISKDGANSKLTEASQYVHCGGHDLKLVDASCQVTRNFSDVERQVSAVDVSWHGTRNFSDAECQVSAIDSCKGDPDSLGALETPMAFAKDDGGKLKQQSLHRDLEISWTERCEVEKRLYEVIAENDILRKRIEQLHIASSWAVNLVEEGSPSVSSWLQLRSCIKEIAAEFLMLRDIQVRNSTDIDVTSKEDNNKTCFVPTTQFQIGVGERSSPEGGRESPGIVDCIINDLETTNVQEGEEISKVIDVQNITLDQSSGALLEVIQELIRRLEDGGVGDGSVLSINTSVLSGNCSALYEPDLCRYLHQMKDEVSRILALSQRRDPEVAQLQDEVKSLEQQVMASDRQVKSTRAFLEEQAAEREVERDESSRKINELTELLKQRDRQLANKEQLQQDLENLEQQLAELQENYENEFEKHDLAKKKLDQKVQKIGSLRDVIGGLEEQLAETRGQLEMERLLVKNQHDRIEDLKTFSLERENAQLNSFSDTIEYTARLEEELTNLRQQMESLGPQSLLAARASLQEIEFSVVRRTRELELIQVAWNANALSSASEELSTRDHIDVTRCATPDEMCLESGASICEDIERLKERIGKLSRVQESAIKKMKEFEMMAAKCDEIRLDHEVVMQKLYESMTENEVLKTKLDAVRIRAQNDEVIEQLERKTKELEKQLEIAQEAVLHKGNLVTEAHRREEKLKETVEGLEAQLRCEELAVEELKKQLELVKAHSSSRWNYSQNLSDSLSNSSSSTPKRVRFQVPESFVSKSITPISAQLPSLLRDASDVDHFPVWNVPVSTTRKPMPWEIISSVSALQLSPRGPPLAESPGVFYSAILDSPTKIETAVNTDLIQTTARATQSEFPTFEELEQKLINDFTRKIKVLEAEVRTYKKLNEEAEAKLFEVKSQAADSNELLQGKCEELNAQIMKQSHRINELERDLRDNISINQKNVDLLSDKNTQLDTISKELVQQRGEAQKLRDVLLSTYKDLEDAKTDRDRILHDKANDKHLEKELHALKQVQKESSEKISELMTANQVLIGEKAKQEEVLIELQKKLEREVAAAEERCEEEKRKAARVMVALEEEGAKKRTAQETVDYLQNHIQAIESRKEDGCEKCQTVGQTSSKCSEMYDSLEESSKWKKYCAELTSRMSGLRSCLEASQLRCASFEAERVLLQTCLDSSINKVKILENALDLERRAVESLRCELQRLQSSDECSLAMSCLESELINSKLRSEELDTQLIKARMDLDAARRDEAMLRQALETAVVFGRETEKKASAFEWRVEELERSNLQLKHSLEIEKVKVRGLEKLQRHMGPFSPSTEVVTNSERAVHSAGFTYELPGSLKWQLNRVESYRKALVFQKHFLLQVNIRTWSGRRRQKPSLRVAALLIISVLRMKFLVRRWRNRLPPLTPGPPLSRKSPVVKEHPLVLNSPPCKDPGLRLNVMQ